MTPMDKAILGKFRRPAVANMFYPGDPVQLARMVDMFLSEAEPTKERPVAIISPHAGYIYSGAIAASAYSPFVGNKTPIKSVILVGPSHRVAFEGMALPEYESFNTPLGRMNLDMDLADHIADMTGVVQMSEPHLMEHSLEVQLPFLQRINPDLKIVPILIGRVSPELIADVMEPYIGRDDVLIVASSDLSHYHDYETARKMDRETAKAICELRTDRVKHDHACGWVAIRGLIDLARRKSLRAETIDLRSSGDTAGSRDQVVGYGAFHFYSQI